jgi:hypothetical protein
MKSAFLEVIISGIEGFQENKSGIYRRTEKFLFLCLTHTHTHTHKHIYTHAHLYLYYDTVCTKPKEFEQMLK